MFRWKKRKRKSLVFRDEHGADVQCAVIFVERAGKDGKRTQQQITYLGRIADSAVEVPAQRSSFWQWVMKQLHQLRKRALKSRARGAHRGGVSREG